jgi:hypothetical protein
MKILTLNQCEYIHKNSSRVQNNLSILMFRAWMKEEKGIIHRGRGAYLRCPVSTAVQFSLHDEGSTEYMCVRGI